MRRAAVVLFLAGCASEPEIPCRPGFTVAQDGHCYPPPPDPRPPAANDVLEQLPACVPRNPGDEIQIATGCIEGACAGDTFAAFDAVLGEGVECEAFEPDWFCTWPQGIQGLFGIEEGDVELPSPDTESSWVRATIGYRGATEEGLGIGIPVSCWVDVLGAPTYAEFVDVVGRLEVRQLVWDPYGVEIEDEQEPGGVELPDGEVDELTLFGPP
jgi:hypothetical protein